MIKNSIPLVLLVSIYTIYRKPLFQYSHIISITFSNSLTQYLFMDSSHFCWELHYNCIIIIKGRPDLDMDNFTRKNIIFCLLFVFSLYQKPVWESYHLLAKDKICITTIGYGARPVLNILLKVMQCLYLCNQKKKISASS